LVLVLAALAPMSALAELDHGAQLFETCGACHGPDGGGTLDGQVPRSGCQHTSVLWKQLIDYRHDRRWDLRMEHFSDRHHLRRTAHCGTARRVPAAAGL
jgi:cytochrome c553